MSKMKKKKIKAKGEGISRRRMRLLVAISTAVVLTVAILVTVLAILFGGGRTVMRVNSARVGEELYSYWLSYGKYSYLREHGGSDTRAYWSSDSGDGITHEQACRLSTERYIVQMLVSAELYDSLGGELSAGEREAIEERAEALLQYDISSRSEYDRLAKKYGFSYSAMCRALIYSYKNETLRTLLTGNGGSTLTDAQIEQYYELTFTRALILEVRTENYYDTDNEGDYIQNPDGTYKLFDMTDEEKAEAGAKIERILAALDADGSLESFEALYATENEDIRRTLYPDGYFFSESSAFSEYYTENLPTGAPDVVSGILSQQIGSYRTYDLGDRTLIVYVTGTTERPYEKASNEDFFHDLATNAAEHYYAKTLGDAIASARVSYDKDLQMKPIREIGYDYRLFFR